MLLAKVERLARSGIGDAVLPTVVGEARLACVLRTVCSIYHATILPNLCDVSRQRGSLKLMDRPFYHRSGELGELFPVLCFGPVS